MDMEGVIIEEVGLNGDDISLFRDSLLPRLRRRIESDQQRLSQQVLRGLIEALPGKVFRRVPFTGTR